MNIDTCFVVKVPKAKMGLMQDVEQHFGVKCLYEVLQVQSSASSVQLKKAYRQLSLKHHPDKFVGDESAVERQTIRFQTLAKVHRLLSDDEMRTLYDEQGVVGTDDQENDSSFDWMQYWRRLFPKVTKADIDEYMRKYIGSDEELNDIRTQYERHAGDLNVMYECLIGYDEQRTRSIIDKLIEDGDLKAMPFYVNESTRSRDQRRRRIEKEKRDFEKSESDAPDQELMAAIRQNSQKREQGFNDWLAGMESRYASVDKKKKKTTTTDEVKPKSSKRTRK